MGGYLGVQSRPVRVNSWVLPRSRRACMRYPSYLISCSHSAPYGAASTRLQKLSLGPLWQTARTGGYRCSHRRRRRQALAHLRDRSRSLFEMLDLGHMLCSVRELKGYALAMATSRGAAAFDDGHLVGHVGVHGVVGDGKTLRHAVPAIIFVNRAGACHRSMR